MNENDAENIINFSEGDVVEIHGDLAEVTSVIDTGGDVVIKAKITEGDRKDEEVEGPADDFKLAA